MQHPNWTQIPLVEMSWKLNVLLDESLVGKALSITNCPVPVCLGWGNVQRHQNAFHRTEEDCPVAAHMRKLGQNKNAHKAVMPTTPNPVPLQAQNPVPHPPLNPAPQFIPPPPPQTTPPKNTYHHSRFMLRSTNSQSRNRSKCPT